MSEGDAKVSSVVRELLYGAVQIIPKVRDRDLMGRKRHLYNDNITKMG